ncbi:hypothetical protein LJC17_02645 [Acholeplasma sp. OttesenSCG-928-E16]|nr:hypothetical protein [Acholeplasma sp. OttesenSCG-928-E16]
MSKLIMGDKSTTTKVQLENYFYKGNFIVETGNVAEFNKELKMLFRVDLLPFKKTVPEERIDKIHKALAIVYFYDLNKELLKDIDFKGYIATAESGQVSDYPLQQHKFSKREVDYEFDGEVNGTIVTFDITKLINSALGQNNVSFVITNDYISTSDDDKLYVFNDLPNDIDSVRFFITTESERRQIEDSFSINKRVGLCDISFKKGVPEYRYELFSNQHVMLSVKKRNDFNGALGSGIVSNLDYDIHLTGLDGYYLDPEGYYRYFRKMSLSEANQYFYVNEPNVDYIFVDVFTQTYIVVIDDFMWIKSRGVELKIEDSKVTEQISNGVIIKYFYSGGLMNTRLSAITRNNKPLNIGFSYNTNDRIQTINDNNNHQKTKITYSNSDISKIEVVKTVDNVDYYLEKTSFNPSGIIVNDEKRDIQFSRLAKNSEEGNYMSNTITDGITHDIDVYTRSSNHITIKESSKTIDYYYNSAGELKFYAIDGKIYNLKYKRCKDGSTHEFNMANTPIRNILNAPSEVLSWSGVSGSNNYSAILNEEIIGTGIEVGQKSGIYQDIMLLGDAEDELVFSCFLKGNYKKRNVKLIIETYDSNDALQEEKTFYFDHLSVEYQILSGSLVVSMPYSKVRYIIQNNSSSSVTIGLMSLYRTDMSNFGDYIAPQDVNGISLNIENAITEFDDENRLTAIITEDRDLITYEYDENSNLVKIYAPTANQTITNTYQNGNLISEEIEKGEETYTNYHEYDDNDHLIRSTDSYSNNSEVFNYLLHNNMYSTDKSGIINKQKYKYDGKLLNNNFIVNEYDISNGLTYQGENLTEISSDIDYVFNYDLKKRLTDVLIGEKKLVTYEYYTHLGKDTSLVQKKYYGNNQNPYYAFTYDEKLRAKTIKLNTSLRYAFDYDDFDRLSQVIYYSLPFNKKEFSYFDNGALKKVDNYLETNGTSTPDYSSTYKYDNLDNLQETNHLLNNLSLKIEYDYSYERTNRGKVYKDIYTKDYFDVITLKKDGRTYKNQLPLENKNLERTVDETLNQAILTFTKNNAQLSYNVSSYTRKCIGIYAWMKIPSGHLGPILWLKDKNNRCYYVDITEDGPTFKPEDDIVYPFDVNPLGVISNDYCLFALSIDENGSKIIINNQIYSVERYALALEIEKAGIGHFGGNDNSVENGVKILSGGIIYDKSLDEIQDELMDALAIAKAPSATPQNKTSFTKNNINSFSQNEFDDDGILIRKEVNHNLGTIIDETITYNENKLPIKVVGSNYETHYDYDEIGNITHKIKFDSYKVVIEANYYEYDDLKRLTKEVIHKGQNQVDKVITYTYDNNGNITSKTVNNDQTFYTYDDSLLTLIEKESSVIENIYNSNNPLFPSNYKNNSLTWEGSRLSSYGNNVYKYDESGFRISKNNGVNTIRYFLEDSKIIFEKRGSLTPLITYKYDINGQLIGFDYGDDSYYYLRDITGIIEGVISSNGTLVNRYVYDAYGNHLVLSSNGQIDSNSASIGNINPFRYKGYYYDVETNLYYLNSRYYDPEVGRFISPDSIEYLDPESIVGLNLYAYCHNNPVMYTDSTGTFAISIFLACLIVGAILGGVTGGINAYNNDVRGWDLVGGIALGTLTGAALGAAVGVVAGLGGVYLAGGVSSVFGKLTTDLMAYSTFGTPIGTWEDYAVAFVFGGLTRGLFGKGPSIGNAIFDIGIRPAVNQFVKMGTGRQAGFDAEKYYYDVGTRAATYLFPSPWRSFARGITRGFWDMYKKGLFGNQSPQFLYA